MRSRLYGDAVIPPAVLDAPMSCSVCGLSLLEYREPKDFRAPEGGRDYTIYRICPGRADFWNGLFSRGHAKFRFFETLGWWRCLEQS